MKTPKDAVLIPGSYAAPEAVAYIAVQKFVMGSPLYRQEQEWNRQGLMLSRQTMSNWLIYCSDNYALPVYLALKTEEMKHDLLHAEESAYILNASGVKGNLKFPVVPGRYALTYNPYVEYTDWDWEIDPSSMRYLWDHYHLPMVITENGFGAHESVGEDGRVHDQYRIDFLRDTIYQLDLAIEDGCDVIGYNPWSYTDLLSTGNGMAKRYGLVYIDTTDEEQVEALSKGLTMLPMKRIKKDSFYWYSDLIKSNGKNWGNNVL